MRVQSLSLKHTTVPSTHKDARNVTSLSIFSFWVMLAWHEYVSRHFLDIGIIGGVLKHEQSLKATPTSCIGSIGVAYSDGDSIALPWVMQITSLPLSGLHYPRLLK